METVAIAVIAYILGFYSRRIYAIGMSAYRKLKYGTCFRYLPTGRLEDRNGTMSDFCRRCGQPAGYHNWPHSC